MDTKAKRKCIVHTEILFWSVVLVFTVLSCTSDNGNEETPVVDTEAPTTPTGLITENVTQTSLYLFWDPATDNVKVKNYSLYQDNEYLVGSGKASYYLEGLVPGTNYTYQVLATDAAGNSSALSSPVNVNTLDPLEAELQFASGNLEEYLGNLLDCFHHYLR
jgi:hypothetical protein